MLLNKSFSIKKLGILSLLCFSGVSVSQTLSCPEEITIHASLKQQYPSWQQFNELSPHYFSSLSLTSGPPDQNATLVPDVTTTTKIVWNLAAGEEYWIVCHYLSSGVGLTQKIPASSKRCWEEVKKVGTKASQPDNKLICE
jgi:hypothetical protein